MVNNRKVRIMTHLAIYEKNNESDLKMSKYYKWDYVRFNVLKTAINVTLAYLGILLLLIVYNIEELVAKSFDLDFIGIGINVTAGYFGLLSIFSLISVLVYSERYKASKKRLTKYYKRLRLLDKIYNEEKPKS